MRTGLTKNILYDCGPGNVTSAAIETLMHTRLEHCGVIVISGAPNALFASKCGDLDKVKLSEVEDRTFDIYCYSTEDFINAINENYKEQ